MIERRKVGKSLLNYSSRFIGKVYKSMIAVEVCLKRTAESALNTLQSFYSFQLRLFLCQLAFFNSSLINKEWESVIFFCSIER